MKFKNIIKNLDIDLSDDILDINIKNVVADSRKVKSGDVFLLLKDDDKAHMKIEQAFEKGAKFVLCNREYPFQNCFVVKNLRSAFAIMNKNLHHGCCDKLKIIGVTGTNGKTTISNLVYDIIKSAGKKVGLIGTLGYKIDDDFVETFFTTPDPDELHAIFDKMVKKGVEYVVMEVSAHALFLHKLDGIKFEIGVLSNITEDHLDFFGSMEEYANAKYMLFENTKRAVVCSDTIDMQTFCQRTNVDVVTYALDCPSDVFAVNVFSSFEGTQFFCNCFDELFEVQTPLIGQYNVLNTLAAICVCHLIKIDEKEICEGLKNAPQIEGRFNIIKLGGKTIVVDFAHTPDGLEKVILAAKQLGENRILTLFGCGGDRDRKKRPIMGKIASNLSDVVVLTSDNPRFEDPLQIIEEISSGAKKQNYLIEPDRAKAVKLILDISKEGDIIIIAGKGGEKYQDFGDKKVEYNDFDEIYNYFRGKIKVIGGKK